MNIRPATLLDLELIHRLAIEIWWPTYEGVIPRDQISFMLDKMYSVEALEKQMNVEGITFVIAEKEGQPVGFMGFSKTDDGDNLYKIHKLYLLPSEQGRGTGSALIRYVSDVATENGVRLLELNVNRNNPAFYFYQKAGFQVFREVDIPYYGYILNDYIMRKAL
jgi:diamine N-acetyltransferase